MGVVVAAVAAMAVEVAVGMEMEVGMAEVEMATDPTHRQQVEQTNEMKNMAFYLGLNLLFLLALPCYGSLDGYDSLGSRDAVGSITMIL